MANIQEVYIADGFADDCDELMHRCQKEEPLTFETFCQIWKDMQLACIYHGRQSGAEIAELSEEVLHIAKHYMVANTSNFEESVAGLFLVYALLNLQPFVGFASLRIVQEDVPAIERIEVVARRDRRQDVLYILGSVLIQGPVQYHAAVRERGMEYPLKKYLEGYSTMSKLGVRPKGVFYRQNEELDIIRELGPLAQRYKMAKAAVNGLGSMDRNLCYVDETLSKNMEDSLKNIISGIIENSDSGDNKSDDSDDIDAIQSLKQKAMKSKVNPMRHLQGVDTRVESNKSPEKKKQDLTSPSGKIKSNSPKKAVTTTSPSKAQKPNKSNARKRPRKSMQTYVNSDEEENSTSSSEDDNTDLDLTNFHKENSTEQEIDITIDTLPCIIRSENDGKSYEIEIIDNYDQAQGSRDKNKSTNEPRPVNKSTKKPGGDELARITKINTGESSKQFVRKPKEKIAKIEKWEQKKSLLKSRFKRLGMLPVANFDTQ